MSPLRMFALLYGVVFLLVGILGFVPGVNQMHTGNPDLVLNGFGTGHLLGLFHVNVLHNLVHILFGVWGLSAYAGMAGGPRTYAQGVAVIYIVLAIAGLVPHLNNLFGLCPLEGNDIWLHVLLAAVAGYFGFVAPSTSATTA